MSKSGTNKVDFEVVDNVAVVTLDHFPVNTLTNAVQLGLEDASNRVSADKSIKAVVVRGAGLRALCAGADIQDLNKRHERYPEKNFVEAFEDLDVPVVALLQGFTLGGGFEMSLGCHYRIITPNGAIGLPEVNIGLLPGGQGTQRLPRLVGVEAALQIMLTGAHVPAPAALKLKVVDKILSKETVTSRDTQLKEALVFVKEVLTKNEPVSSKRLSQLPPPKVDAAVFDKFSKQMKQKRGMEMAPFKIIDAVKACCNSPSFEEGVEKEMELFAQVLVSKEAQGLQHIFFSERSAAKVPKSFATKPMKLKTVGVIGAGTMGTGIAMSFAEVGKKVVIVDIKQEFLDRGMKVIKTNYERSVKRGSKKPQQVEKFLANISTSVSYDDLKDADLVVEAVFEDMKLKKEILAKLDNATKPSCILASNTSYLNIDEMASATKNPHKVIGMHFFSPANVMKLVEVIKGEKTDNETMSTIMLESSRLGKWPVLMNNSHGFVGNRMISSYGSIAVKLALTGNDIEVIDAAAKKFGMPMGPLRMADLVGLDLGYQARQRNGQVDEKKNIVDAFIAKGRRGMKTGKGYYDYEGRKQTRSKEADEIIAQVIKNNNLPQEILSEEEIQQRLFYPIINEGFRVLEDGVAFKPEDIDVVYVHGYNWPRVTGGVMFYADMVGTKTILNVLEKIYAKTNDPLFKPAPLLKEVAASGMSLAKFWKKNGSNYVFKGPSSNL